MAVAAHAVDAGLGLEVLLISIVDKGVEALDGLDPDVAAAAAVAAVGAAVLDVLLAPERDRAAAAVAGADVDLDLVEELHRSTARTVSAAAIDFSTAPGRNGSTA